MLDNMYFVSTMEKKVTKIKTHMSTAQAKGDN